MPKEETTSNRRQLVGNMGALLIYQGGQFALPLITLPYLVRVLGPEKYGLIAFSQIFISYFIVVSNYGFDLSATRRIAIHRKDLRKVSEIFSTVMAVQLIITLALFLLMAAIVFTVPRFRPDWPVYFLSFISVVGSVSFPVWFFQGMEKMKYMPMRNIAGRLLALIGLVAFVHSEADYLLAVGIQAGGYLLAGTWGLLYAVRKVAPVSVVIPSRKQIITTVREGWDVFVSRISGGLLATSVGFVLGLFYGNVVVGYYSIAEKVVRAAIYSTVPVSQGIYPRVNALFAEAPASALAFLRKTLLLGGLTFLFVSVTLFLSADLAVRLVVGESESSVSMLIIIMSVLPLTVFLSNLYGTQILLSVGKKREFMKAMLYTGLSTVIFSLLLVPPFGAVGAAIALVLSEVLSLVLQAIPVRRMGIKLGLGA